MQPKEETEARIRPVLDYLNRKDYFSDSHTMLFFDHILEYSPEEAIRFSNKVDYDDNTFEDFTEVLEKEQAKIEKIAGKPVARRIWKMVLEGGTPELPTRIDPQRLGANLSPEEREILGAHFDSIMLGWALSLATQADSKIFEQSATALSQNLIPCGWMGRHPRGKIIVYLPKNLQHRKLDK